MNVKSGETHPLVSIVICHWNGGQDIIDCLDSIQKQSYKNIETILSDNASSDGSPEIIEKNYPRVKVIRNEKNLGFAEGNNVGIRAARGEYVVTINQDLTLDERFIEKIIKRFQACDETTGIIGGKILKRDGRLIDSAGLRLSRARRFFDIGAEEPDTGQYDTEREVFGICAAAAAFRRSALESLHGAEDGKFFDPRFFLLVEDVDLCWRLRHAGYSALYYPEALCYHRRGGADWKNRNKQYLSFRNRIFMMYKNDYLVNMLRHLPWIVIYDTIRFFYMLLKNRYLFKGVAEIISELPSLLRERKKILRGSRVKPREMAKWFR